MTTRIVPHEAKDLIDKLGLEPHPEGGFSRETFRDPATDATGRARSTARCCRREVSGPSCTLMDRNSISSSQVGLAME